MPMQHLVKELQNSGLTLEQVREILTIICKWTNQNHPVMGAVIENMLRKNQLIEYPM